MTSVDAVLSGLTSQTGLPELLRRLGRACLDVRRQIELDSYVRGADAYHRSLNAATDVSLTSFDIDGSNTSGEFAKMSAAVSPLRSHPALALVTLLEGMCRGAGRRYFRATATVEVIERGMVLPLPQRHIAGWSTTPNPATTHNVLLDPACGFLLWEADWIIELDYTFRDRVETICWNDTGQTVRGVPVHRLPTISTLHPFTGEEMAAPDTMADGRFFGVHPVVADPTPTAQDNLRRVTDLLVEVGNRADIAVIPEFTMHSPDAAASALVDGQERPPIVVAGTAHHHDNGTHANVSVTYLDGVPVLTTSKHYPFVYRVRPERAATRHVDGANAGLDVEPARPDTYREHLTPRDRIFRFVSSDSTRLAVVVCSDLNSVELLGVLNTAGVNLLLCPAWTPRVGTFVGALEAMAAYSQCLSVIANTPGHPSASSEPFWAITMVPREGARPLLHRPADPTARAGIADANEEPEDAPPYWTWL